MSAVQQQITRLVYESKALKHFYQIESDRVSSLIEHISALWLSADDVSEPLQAAINDLEAAIEDTCLMFGVVQEELEHAMENDIAFLKSLPTPLH